MTTRAMQAKDIPDELMLRVIRSLSRAGDANPEDPDSNWTMIWDVVDSVALHLPVRPPDKVVLAKLSRLMDRRLIDGCDCGCRGDFHLLADTIERLNPAPIRVAVRYPEQRIVEPPESFDP